MGKLQDPRMVKSRAAVLAAARAIMEEEGPEAVTHQRVAQRAGVGRATVYRHWPQPEHLLQQVMAEVDLPFFRHPEEPLSRWLCQELRRVADELSIPAVAGAALTLLQRAHWDEVTRGHRDHLHEVISDRLDVAFAQARTREEILKTPDTGQTAALLLGPVLYRTAMQAEPVSDAFISQVVASALAAAV